MILKSYSVYDNKAVAFLPPFFMFNDAVACRAFSDAVNDPSHQFHKNPTDYNLFCVGSFDDSTGVLVTQVTFDNLGMAANFLGG